MADSYKITVKSHNSIYSKKLDINSYDRDLNIYFSTPSAGVNNETGICILIAGFGGESKSNVYKKMRDTFADQYNLVVLQCQYFGWEFMQDPPKVDIERINMNQQSVFANMGESPENFADMGILQAIDHIVAVLNIINIMFENDLQFNARKIILYGQSQGAYLSYLCNALAPDLFSLIIDNSAWIYPVYLRRDRKLYYKFIEPPLINNTKSSSQSFIGCIKMAYLGKTLLKDKDILSLPMLYRGFRNRCKIVSYHGTQDDLILCSDKKAFCEKISNLTFHEISNHQLDSKIFKSTSHGLDADFLALFDHAMTHENVVFAKDSTFQLTPKVVYQFIDYRYTFNYENVFPVITMEKV